MNLIRVIPAEGSRRPLVSTHLKAALSARSGDAAFVMSAADVAEIQIELNGEARKIEGDARLTALIEQLKLRRGRIAVEINRAVIPKAAWGEITLRNGDTVEIVNFVGGG